MALNEPSGERGEGCKGGKNSFSLNGCPPRLSSQINTVRSSKFSIKTFCMLLVFKKIFNQGKLGNEEK